VSPVRISRALWDELVAHAREEKPIECCGYGRFRKGEIDELVRATNTRHSRYGFELDRPSVYQAWKYEEDGDGTVLYHSHPFSPAQPSEQDRNLFSFPDWLYVIVSLENDAPDVRAWWVREGDVEEEPIEIE
jgi:proteasome lid subunit RPN8/RPN11